MLASNTLAVPPADNGILGSGVTETLLKHDDLL
jgi:hypothetical protein